MERLNKAARLYRDEVVREVARTIDEEDFYGTYAYGVSEYTEVELPQGVTLNGRSVVEVLSATSD